jgi:hypothetical protein
MTFTLLGRSPGGDWSSTTGCPQRTPSQRIWRTWLRPTRMPSARASLGQGVQVQCAGGSGWARASSPSPPW